MQTLTSVNIGAPNTTPFTESLGPQPSSHHHMSTTRPPLPSPSTKPSKTLNPIFSPSLLPHPQRLLRSYAKNFQIRCELRSINDPQTWTVDCVTGSDPIHIILKPPPFSIPMGSNSGLGSNSMTAKKVCLFHCAEMKALAERIAAESDAIELRSITWR